MNVADRWKFLSCISRRSDHRQENCDAESDAGRGGGDLNPKGAPGDNHIEVDRNVDIQQELAKNARQVESGDDATEKKQENMNKIVDENYLKF